MVVGTQFTGSVAANSSHRWFTFGWPAAWEVIWTVVPTTPVTGAPQLTWNVAVERASATDITYWITISNLTGAQIDIEARYAITNI
jgi:hypothetical protein